MSKNIIEFENLTKYYKKTLALDGLNEKIPKGITGFIGPNGAGKTTTIKILMGLVRPTNGTIYVFGQDILKRGIEIRKKIGYLPERNALLLNQTAFSFLGYLSKIYGFSNMSLKERIIEVLEIVGIEKEWWHQKLRKYSSGMRQRVGLARAILNPNVKLVILDEPTVNLDPIGRNFFIKLIKQLNSKENINFFISSHILSELEQVSENIVIINKGKIIALKTLNELKKHIIATPTFKIKTSNNAKILTELKREGKINYEVIENETYLKIKTDNSEGLKKLVTQIVVRNDIVLDEFEEIKMDLEEIFLSSIRNK
ncbi:MAG: ABC transporter ATP-binding protein [Candidatus Helarchaeota archaeon]